MTKKERVTVDFDEESYYLDGEFWVSWDKYGEHMADTINDLLNSQEERIRELEKENERLKEKGEYCDNICKSFGDYYGMNIENAEWFGFKGDVE